MDSVCAIIFMGCCIFLPMICDIISTSKNEKIEVIKYISYAIPQQPIEKIENPLKAEAIECLISLGMKKSQANKKVSDMFKKSDYKSIESFLLDVYKV